MIKNRGSLDSGMEERGIVTQELPVSTKLLHFFADIQRDDQGQQPDFYF